VLAFLGAIGCTVETAGGSASPAGSGDLGAQPDARSPGGHVVVGGAIDDGTKGALSTWLEEMVTDDPRLERQRGRHQPPVTTKPPPTRPHPVRFSIAVMRCSWSAT